MTDESRLLAMAEEIFDLSVLASLRRSSTRSAKTPDVSETEFLTLDILAKHEPITIGEIQKKVGVVPAQMSRIVRTLEDTGGKGFVHCSINPEDRRRVDLTLTDDGKKIYESYRSERLKSTVDVLKALSADDQEHFLRILRKIRDHVAKSIRRKSPK